MENTKFKVYSEEKSQDYGKFYIEPLERGYGDTLGNALRRLLLSSIRGAAVTAVKIDGVLHEFSTIKGIREDVIEILMNLKHIPIKARTENATVNEDGFKIITLDSDDLPKDFFTREENPGVITAQDINAVAWDHDYEFCGNGMLCTLEPDAHLLMEIYVEQGTGYLSAERERPSQPPLPIDAMLADAIFSPVKRVNYRIEPARVGQSIDYERLILEVWTNGAITPEEAASQAAGIARDYFSEIAETINTAPVTPVVVKEVEPPKPPQPPVPDTRPIHELDLSIRSENCLMRGGITTIGELLKRSRDDLLKFRNLGRKSLTEIEEKLTARGYVLAPSKPEDSESESTADEDKPAKPARTRKSRAKAETKPETEAEDTPEAENAENEPEANPED
ncbi:MAG: DNA-directed RNA polymerase subunit alpha [Synergistaceae bacterium]|nr:DNA-directed RNA polymerase subunit alpha [Synergistaceae bacterium]